MRQAERRARTTLRLLDAAADVFARQGFHAATVDDIADAAGYTKGAVYANFAGKDALFLALLDRHLENQLAYVDRMVSTPDAELRAGLHEASRDHMATGGSFGLLMLEFWLYAARNAKARSALAARYRRMRDRLAGMIDERDATRGIAGSRTPGEIAALVLALDAGLFLQHLVDPDAITPELRANAIAAVIGQARPG